MSSGIDQNLTHFQQENWDRATDELSALEAAGNTYRMKTVSHENGLYIIECAKHAQK